MIKNQAPVFYRVSPTIIYIGCPWTNIILNESMNVKFFVIELYVGCVIESINYNI